MTVWLKLSEKDLQLSAVFVVTVFFQGKRSRRDLKFFTHVTGNFRMNVCFTHNATGNHWKLEQTHLEDPLGNLHMEPGNCQKPNRNQSVSLFSLLKGVDILLHSLLPGGEQEVEQTRGLRAQERAEKAHAWTCSGLFQIRRSRVEFGSSKDSIVHMP